MFVNHASARHLVAGKPLELQLPFTFGNFCEEHGLLPYLTESESLMGSNFGWIRSIGSSGNKVGDWEIRRVSA
jgi:hypothetical protein